MTPTLRYLRSTYGLSEPTAYRVLAELSGGACMSTALLNAMQPPGGTSPTIYGGLFLPPEAYTADGRLYGLAVTVGK